MCARLELFARRVNAARATHAAGVPRVLHLLLLALSLAAPPAAAQPTLRGVQDSEGNAVVLPEPEAVTVVQFMATWCAPCHEQTRALVNCTRPTPHAASASRLSRSTEPPSTTSSPSTLKSLLFRIRCSSEGLWPY